MNARKPILVGLISVFATWGGFALAGVSAQAAVIHDYLSQITEVPASSDAPQPGPLNSVNSMTIDSGHLWIAETAQLAEDSKSRIDEFEASTGAFISQLAHSEGSISYGDLSSHGGIAVGHGTGEAIVYVEEQAGGKASVARFHEGGSRLGAWSGAATPSGSFGSEITGIAIDNSSDPFDEAKGDVYVAVPNAIYVFHPEVNGEERYVGQITGAAPSESFMYLKGLEVDEGNGNLIVDDRGSGTATIDVLEPKTLGEYTLVHKITGISPGKPFADNYTGTADASNGEIYVTERESGGKGAIDEFNAGGEYIGRITGLNAPQGNFSQTFLSLAVDPSSHDLYVAIQTVGIDVLGPDVVVPDIATGPVTSSKTRSATLTGTVNPDQVGAATCQFTWGSTTALGRTAACSAPVAEGDSPTPVEAQISGLEPDTTYYYLLQANNANGTNPGEPSEIQHFTTPGSKLEGEGVSAVTDDSVTFDAVIDPHKAPTTYYFQYGTSTEYGHNLPAAPGEEVGAGELAIEFSEHVQDLSPETTYHYRVVVLSEVEPGNIEEFDGVDRTFTTQRASGTVSLPDGRQWELVTPASKEGALFYAQSHGNVAGTGAPDPFVAKASANGEAMVNLASQPTEADPQGNSNEVSVLSTRGPAGWSSQVIAPPNEEGTGPSIGEGGQYNFFSEDLSHAILYQFGNFFALSPEATESTPYLRTDYLNGSVDQHCQTNCYRPLVTAANTRDGVEFGDEVNGGECEYFICGPRLLDATPDAEHIVIGSLEQLTAVPMEGTGDSYYYEWANGKLQPVYLLPEDEGGAGLRPEESRFAERQLSDDGSVYFTHDGHIYLHDIPTEESIRLDVARGVVEPSDGDAQFLFASGDGARLLFTDSKQLLPEAIGGGIYECRIVESPHATHCELALTVLPGSDLTPNSLIGGSQDGNRLYFLAGDRLEIASYEFGAWSTHEGPLVGKDTAAAVEAKAEAHNYRVSPSGDFFTFMSDEDLTGYDTRDAVSGALDEEVYLYEAGAKRLICASCDPTGGRPVGVPSRNTFLAGGSEELLQRGATIAANLPPWTESNGYGHRFLYQPRFLSDSGRLFFDSADSLVPQDVDGTEDVYEYEPAGVGGCVLTSATYSERSNGCVDLISSGSSPEESAFMDASETGDDVFFITLSKLVPQDYDAALDVYDAHACTSSVPCYPAPPVTPPVCFTGDACKAAPTPQPSIFGPAASGTFSGVGNVTPSTSGLGVKPKSLTRGQKLVQALKGCKKLRKHKQRAVCERQAHKRYGPIKKKPAKAGARPKGRG